MKLTTIILAKQGEAYLKKAVSSVNFSDEILTVKNDSISDFSKVRNEIMKKAKGEWILFMDADEIVTKELKAEIDSLIQSSHKEHVSAFYLRRKDFFWNQELQWGEVRKVRELGIIRLMKKDSGQWVGKVHEEFLPKGHVGRLNGFINHYPHQTLKEFLGEVNLYSSLRAEELQKKGKSTNIFEIVFFPAVKFIYTYFLKLGFLDGAAGFTYAFMMSFHSFLVRSKLYQFTKIKT